MKYLYCALTLTCVTFLTVEPTLAQVGATSMWPSANGRSISAVFDENETPSCGGTAVIGAGGATPNQVTGSYSSASGQSQTFTASFNGTKATCFAALNTVVSQIDPLISNPPLCSPEGSAWSADVFASQGVCAQLP